MTTTLERAVAPPGARWHAHRYNRPGYYQLAAAAARRLPRPLRTRVAGRLGRLLMACFPRERTAIRRNLARIHPGCGPAWLDGAVAQVFARFAVCFADLLSLNRGPDAEIWRYVTGLDVTDHPAGAAVARGRGCVTLTAHLGNWELAGRLLPVTGRKVHVVMAPEVDPGVGALLARGGGVAVRFVRLTSPMVGVELVAALRRGEVVAFQVDRAMGGRGDAAVPFFGSPARFPLGPFVMAAAAGAPVVSAFCVLERDGRYRLHAEPPFDVSRGAEEDALRVAVGTLERYVRAHWDQWFNFYDVWGPAA